MSAPAAVFSATLRVVTPDGPLIRATPRSSLARFVVRVRLVDRVRLAHRRRWRRAVRQADLVGPTAELVATPSFDPVEILDAWCSRAGIQIAGRGRARVRDQDQQSRLTLVRPPAQDLVAADLRRRAWGASQLSWMPSTTRLAVRLLGFCSGPACAHTSLTNRHSATSNATVAASAVPASSRARARIGAGRRGKGVASRFLTAASGPLYATEPVFLRSHRIPSVHERSHELWGYIDEFFSVCSPMWTISALVAERLSRRSPSHAPSGRPRFRVCQIAPLRPRTSGDGVRSMQQRHNQIRHRHPFVRCTRARSGI